MEYKFVYVVIGKSLNIKLKIFSAEMLHFLEFRITETGYMKIHFGFHIFLNINLQKTFFVQ